MECCLGTRTMQGSLREQVILLLLSRGVHYHHTFGSFHLTSNQVLFFFNVSQMCLQIYFTSIKHTISLCFHTLCTLPSPFLLSESSKIPNPLHWAKWSHILLNRWKHYDLFLHLPTTNPTNPRLSRSFLSSFLLHCRARIYFQDNCMSLFKYSSRIAVSWHVQDL